MKVTIEVDDKDVNKVMQRLNRISRSPHGQLFFEALTSALQTIADRGLVDLESVKIYDRPAKKTKAKATRRRRPDAKKASKS
jgi:hypothetical protein